MFGFFQLGIQGAFFGSIMTSVKKCMPYLFGSRHLGPPKEIYSIQFGHKGGVQWAASNLTLHKIDSCYHCCFYYYDFGLAGAAIFDMEYARWLEDDHRHMSELRTGLQAHLLDGDLRVIVDGYLSHYDEIFRLKGVAAKSDVFHLITGMWTTPAERCFLWMGGFRPSDLIKV